MCGIFGLVRNQNADHPERATAIINELGILSVERGRDSSGLAYISPTATKSELGVSLADVRKPTLGLLGGVQIVKDTVPFNRFWDDNRDSMLAGIAAAIIGHTRAATQGSRSDLANTSPLAVGTLVGTHNGDIDADSVEGWAKSPTVNFGGTDTESLYRAIDSVRSHRGKIRNILSEAEGRVALAWYDRKYPNRINLARGGLSPLAIATDNEGNMFWASSPLWFKKIEEKFQGMVKFKDTFIVKEGTLITLMFDTGKPVIESVREFEPTVRESDTFLSPSIVWRGWQETAREIDQSQAIHKVAPPKPKPVFTGGYQRGTGGTSRALTGHKSTTRSYFPSAGSEPSPFEVQECLDDNFNQDYWGDEDYSLPQPIIDGTTTLVDHALTHITEMEEKIDPESMEKVIELIDNELQHFTNEVKVEMYNASITMLNTLSINAVHLAISDTVGFNESKALFQQIIPKFDGWTDEHFFYMILVLLSQFPVNFGID